MVIEKLCTEKEKARVNLSKYDIKKLWRNVTLRNTNTGGI